MSDALVSVAATQGMPHEYLALVARRACVPGSHGTVTIRETDLRTQSLSVLVLEFQPEV